MNESPELVLDGSAPIWQQIAEQIRSLVLSGALLPGEELPTVRALAVGLAVNPRAVEHAYAQLERTGLVSAADESVHLVAKAGGDEVNADLKQLCEDFLRAAAGRGYSVAAVLHALGAYLEEEVRHEQAD
jgi:GntR family transcriptional regulator